MINRNEAAKKVIVITVDVIMNAKEEVVKRQLMSKVKTFKESLISEVINITFLDFMIEFYVF